MPPSHEDWLTEEEWVARVSSAEDEEWFFASEDPEDDSGSGVPAPPGSGKSAGRAAKRNVRAAKGSRRGPEQPGSARRVPDASPGPGGAFATGHPLDIAAGGAALHGLAEYAAGADDRFGGTTDDELTGVICALDRAEAAASALKHAAVAELIRRRPAPDCDPVLAAPGSWEEFTSSELSYALAETRWEAESMLDLAHDDTSSGLAFQLAPDHQPPSWPDPDRPQQVHLDIMVEDVAAAGPRVLALGATRLNGEGVYADPAGHPFCLIRRPRWAVPIPSPAGS